MLFIPKLDGAQELRQLVWLIFPTSWCGKEEVDLEVGYSCRILYCAVFSLCPMLSS